MIKIIYNRTTNYNKMIKKKYSKKSNKINLNKMKIKFLIKIKQVYNIKQFLNMMKKYLNHKNKE